MTKTTKTSRIEELNREIEILTPSVIRFRDLDLDLEATDLTGVQQQLADRAALYCELIAERTKLEG